MTESGKFDLLAMGRPEGPGCYCYVNTLLRKIVDAIANNYAFVVMDAEAGLEHLSRRTTRDVDIMLVATDASVRSIETAGRVLELSKQLQTRARAIYAIANRVPDTLVGSVTQSIEKVGLDCVAMIPEDPLIREFDVSGKPLMMLPEDSCAYQQVKALMKRLCPTVD
jgi:CO dehydrogenase maturation factor